MGKYLGIQGTTTIDAQRTDPVQKETRMATLTAPVEPEDADLVSLPIRAETLAELQKLAEADGVSVLTYLGSCVSFRRWVDEILKDGGKIITKPKHGPSEVITNR